MKCAQLGPLRVLMRADTDKMASHRFSNSRRFHTGRVTSLRAYRGLWASTTSLHMHLPA